MRKHFVNATSNSFGNGIFDGYSIVVGQRIFGKPSPTRTTSSRTRTAGTTPPESENGDKCAWIETQNITLGGVSSRAADVEQRSVRRRQGRLRRLALTNMHVSEAGHRPASLW